MRYNNAIVVVVYNKKIEDSATLNTLVEHDFFNSKLVIHNNGPESIALQGKLAEKIEAKFKCVELINSLNNLPLSMLYNDFIRDNEEAGRFIILDDDSTITEAFARAVNYNEDDMELPRIISRVDGVTYYPIETKKVVTTERYLDHRTSYSIGSGMVINNSLVKKFQEHNVDLFDENYALYGVDVSVFRRIYQLIDKGEAFKIKSSSYIYHSLSRAEGKESPFRIRERLIDTAITTRRYPTVRLHIHLMKKLIINVIKLNGNNAASIIKAYLTGMHPRCKTMGSRQK
ncbi:glycosyl transferase [Serratia marcescens]|uniref:glycosyl transferase n=1 Tax=Serratia marcescens TaxID=615 RepID=UPI001867FEDC|nr:glycosyl transferase [Serratia marcescens]HAT4914913.1 glycosyl transferase [Serratia marcescens]